MKTVVVPHISEFTDKKFEISYIKLRRLSEFSEVHLDRIVNEIS
jgi:sugar-phosphatase